MSQDVAQQNPKQFIFEPQGYVMLWIFNNGGGNIYIGKDQTSAKADQGMPILPNIFVQPFLWYGDLWISADLDASPFRYEISRKIDFDAFKGGETSDKANDGMGGVICSGALYRGNG